MKRVLESLLLLALGAPAADDTAEQILAATGVRGGLVVHLGCGDGKLTAALRANERYLVHGLAADPGDVARARAFIQSRGLYGPVSVDRIEGASLPYADDLVNLVVSGNPGPVSKDEILRVLCPGGAAHLKEADGWKTIRKPRPESIDEWTHFLHDASNNAVARDTRVGPPRRMQWVCGPLWTRSHEHTSSLVAMVSAGGRVFYLFDEGLTGVTPATLPERWNLIARDAFNGTLLWKRPIEDWRAGVWKNMSLRGVPPSVQRLLVAEGDRVFVPLGLAAPVSILDAATGEALAVCEGTDRPEEMRCLDGVLLVRRNPGGVLAFDVKEGRRLWQSESAPLPETMAAENGRVFFVERNEVVCLDLKTGQERWKSAASAGEAGGKPAKKGASSDAPFLMACGDRLLLADRQGLRALDAGTGKPLWTAKGSLGGRGELFAAGGRAWRWEGHGFAGHDLATGEVQATIDADEVFTPGHHLRCYQSKATVNYLITPWRGVEFVSIAGGGHTQNDWLRGPCRYGVMPCNGLLYAPPNPCFCYPGAKVTGFNVLAPAAPDAPVPDPAPRLEKGPAYGEAAALASAAPPAETDWPTYRRDARRTGATGGEVPAETAPRWKTSLGGALTPPVFAHGRVYAAARDAHTLHALQAEDGARAWQFTAGGRIDSPPTACGGLVLFGCADGYVYCLRASDGELAWKYRAAPRDERIGAFGQIESRWPVHGSVLPLGGLVYGTAGRSTFLDSGVRVFALEPGTGALRHETTLDSWSRTRADAAGKPFVPAYHMEGSHSDILVSEGGSIFMGQYQLDASLAGQEVPYVIPGKGDEKVKGMDLAGKPFVSTDVEKTQPLEVHQRKWLENAAKSLVAELREKHGAFNIGHRRMGRHVFSTAGFLDDSWYNRTFWMYSESWPGYYLAHRAAKTGQLLVVGPERSYAVQAYPDRNMQSPLFTPGEKGYLLFADANDNEPVLSDETRETTKGWGFTRAAPPAWHDWLPVRVRGMVLAGRRLFVAGPPDEVDPADPMASFEGRKGAVLRAYAAADGKMLEERKLEAPPVFDGLIAAAGRLYLCTTDGKILCLGGTE